VIFGALGLIWIHRALRGRAERMLGIPREYAMHLAFFVFAFLSTTWSMDPEVWDRLLATAPYLVLYALLVPSLLASTRGITEAYQWITWMGGAMCIVFLFVYSEASGSIRIILAAETGTGDSLGLNPLAVGSMAAFTVVAAALGDFPRRRLISVLRLLITVVALVVAGRSSRGDLFAALITLAFLGMIPTIAARGIEARRLIAGLLVIAVGAAVLYYGLFLTDYWVRYQNLDADEGTLLRQQMISDVWNYYVDHPSTWLFGSGWSSSYVIAGFYPHNGAVQALGETGIVGAVLWCSSVVYVFTRGLRLAFLANRTGSRSLDVVRPALALMLCALIDNMKAGDCIDISLALTLGTASQLIRRFRPESEKSLLR
jgi:O-antigen ligase